jgi:cadmium resistance protein CadD (predicted permease)
VDVIGLIGLGIAAFAATNIDDLFIMMIFFSSARNNFSPREIVLGQYIGIGALTAIGVVGSLVALIVPAYVVGLMGFVPIAIGIKKLLGLRKHPEEKDEVPKQALNNSNRTALLSVFTVTAVTLSNGGDNIGVYVPLFASNNTATEIITLVAVFMAMTAAWCAIGYYLVNHSFLASRIRRFGHLVLPFVLIGLGTYILAKGIIIASS